ncbi:unnamed protein product [Nippostrongylus brasiliensis]|uniref:Conserved secreted protein n=1 Tax=Nippostrongylus brasiliensis TaxID=27835 RepID=A0A0N4YJJ2_NIPBR|nr:unnamed protein product [Nippostrongylus brasiliensis]
MIQMLYLQLFAVLVALPFSDGAVLNGLKCEYEPGSQFCRHLLAAYRQNRDTLLRKFPEKFDYAMYKLRNANGGIHMVLSETEKSGLLWRLRLVLNSENNALVAVLKECNNSVIESTCSTIFQGIFSASEDLVEAIIEVAEGEKKDRINGLFQAFGREQNNTGKFQEFLNNTLKALE